MPLKLHNGVHMTEISNLRRQGVSKRPVLSHNLSTFLVLVSMGFDGLRTVKADNNDTAVEGMLIRYGDASAQIAFATGAWECAEQTLLMIHDPLVCCLLLVAFKQS